VERAVVLLKFGVGPVERAVIPLQRAVIAL
jgi:hypothetical protein